MQAKNAGPSKGCFKAIIALVAFSLSHFASSVFTSQGLRNEQLREHFTERYLHLVPIINSCLAEV